ncbi:hypothetical protein GGS26DRAFT_435232 [Hypomontagnella submonticulosa]|nr:hypothetical protein GGS26DRAFT_435232 [Hypomontagnella submonticulosa]
MATLKRQALGEAASLGSLYDARTDTFIPLSILNGQPLAEAVKVTETHKTVVKFIRSETNRERLSNTNVSAALGASFLSGMVTVDGSGNYLSNARSSKEVMEASLLYNVTTKSEKLRLSDIEAENALRVKTLKTSFATHVVVGIDWGADTIIAFRSTISEENDRTKIEGRFKLAFDKLKLVTVSGDADLALDDSEGDDLSNLEFTVFGDVLADDGAMPVDLDTALRFMKNLPQYIRKANGGKGKPIVYTLLPIETLSMFWPDDIQIEADSPCLSIGSEYLEKFVQLFDEIHDAECALNDYHDFILRHSTYVPVGHREKVSDNRNQVRRRQAFLKGEYARLLQEIRSGRAKPEELTSLYDGFHKGDDALGNLTGVISQYADKIDFIVTMVSNGARCISDDGLSMETELVKNDRDDAFVFYFTESARKACEHWRDLFATLLSLARDEGSRALILLVDEGDKTSSHPRPIIVQYRNGKQIVEDVYEERKLLEEKCLMLYDTSKLERDVVARPLARRPVRLPCPGVHCNQATTDEWICRVCQTPAQYGHTDSYIYCNCGRTWYSEYGFRCNRSTHGSTFTKYSNDAHLKRLLDNLEPFQELNILILGETGVGKSTFINAFVNYIKYESMEEALKVKNLDWLIPCSFSTQQVDEDDPDGRLIETKIQIGSSSSERDGATGQSATQETSFYPFQLGDVTVRLIDTPGIGDTRGVDQDKKNMANILNVLSQFEKIHGIIILLKPNASRLTVVFRFCIEELLTHLHRDAARNMVFGFTNARASNYRPGDTFIPLQNLLKKYGDFENPGSPDTSKKLRLGLYRDNTYYFDSESFRYLAAYTQGIDLGNRDEYSYSWNFSADESRRLLQYFKSLEPHQVKNTLSLNDTRRTITRLTQPMAEIMQAINASIALNEDAANTLRTKELTLKELKPKLNVQQVELHATPLDRPRTVCGNSNCFKYRNGRNGTKVAVYEKFCHDPCYLANVEADTVGHPQLIDCLAFHNTKDRTCRNCEHNWQEHLHISYQLHEETVTVPDPDIQDAITRNVSSIKLQENAIKKMDETIEEYKLEHSKVQQAAVDFSLFLKANSIAPYNDAMVEYLDLLIKQEKGKVSVGGSQDRLERLEQSRLEYKQLIETFETNLRNGDGHRVLSCNEVGTKVKDLFALKHYGPQLRKAVMVVDKAHLDEFREKPNRILHIPSKSRGNKNRGFWSFIKSFVRRQA